jgi:CRISPR/Cas system-associated exonuclease Cas4 (RecB family)
MLEEWRNNFKGVQYHHEPTNLLIFGAIDDLWKTPGGEYIVVDYKSTSKNEEIKALDKDWHDAYKRQMEIYQWLLRRNGLNVSGKGYFIYCNGNAGLDKFDSRLEFDMSLIAYEGKDGWVEKVIADMHRCLNSEVPPPEGLNCDFCAYRRAAKEVL